MKLLARVLLALVLLLALAAAAIQLTGHGYLWTAVRHTYLEGHNTAHIDDARNFPQAPVPGAAGAPWRQGPWRPLSPGMRAYLQQHRTAAFLVVHRGALVHEAYFAPYHPESRTNVFSMAKTVVTLLAGAAAMDGLLPSFDAPLAQWVPEYAEDPRGRRATLAQLSAMTAGHDWTENYYLPLNPMTELYFGGNTQRTVLRHGFERDPGTAFEYSSASTQLLAIALQRALQQRHAQLTLAAYASQRLWQPLGLGGASWSLDRPRAQGGMELAYCCIHARARDVARLAQLLLQRGQWEGRALLDPAFVDRITRPNGHVTYYGHGLWMDPQHQPPFYFLQGHLGQYAIVVPSQELVIVRLGQWRTKQRGRHPVHPEEVYLYVEEALRMVGSP